MITKPNRRKAAYAVNNTKLSLRVSIKCHEDDIKPFVLTAGSY
jgi:hypothetical protein